MSHASGKITMDNNTYIAWALYTGPSHTKPLWEKSRWITGEWDGINKSTVEEDIRADIDARVKMVLDAFTFARKEARKLERETAVHFFVIPEFFFHCKQGPYPNIKLAGYYPFEYITDLLRTSFTKVLAGDSSAGDELWVVCAGSILTCNIPDFNLLLNSREVTARLQALNNAMSNLAVEKAKLNMDDSISPLHIRALSFENKPTTGAQQEIDDLMSEYRANPLCVVRNRGILISLGNKSINTFIYEKQSESTVDLTMGKRIALHGPNQLETGGMITEWMANYPSISIINGDKNCQSTPLAARISLNEPDCFPVPLEIGVEICLDHRLKRLRRSADMKKEYGASANNPPLDIQLIASGGMQILDYSVTAGVNGVVFNCDGCDPIMYEYYDYSQPVIPDSGKFKQITCGIYASSVQKMVQVDGNKYYSHSQLCFRYGSEEIPGYNNALGSRNANGSTYGADGMNPLLDSYPEPEILEAPGSTPGLFAAGAGELHLYLKKKTSV